MTLAAMAKHIELWLLKKLIPYAKNPRTHSDAQIAQIAARIQTPSCPRLSEFGTTNSCSDRRLVFEFDPARHVTRPSVFYPPAVVI
jgi:hypothetical protein